MFKKMLKPGITAGAIGGIVSIVVSVLLVLALLLPGQAGITGMLDGDEMFIKPQGFDELHDRHGVQHRLKDEKKWQPLGIGSGETVHKDEV